MNRVNAKVDSINSIKNLAIVHFRLGEYSLEMMSLGVHSKVKPGSEVLLGVKATAITLAKDFEGSISTSNRLECSVKSVDNGELLSSIELLVGDATLESVITKEASIAMDLQIDDKVTALIKASDLSILEVKE